MAGPKREPEASGLRLGAEAQQDSVPAADPWEQLQSQLAASEERFMGLIANFRDGILEVDPNGIVRRVNPALAVMLGYDSPERLLQSAPRLSALLDGPDEGRFRASVGRSPVRLRLRRQDGAAVPVSAILQAVGAGPDQVIEALVQELNVPRPTTTPVPLEAIVEAVDEAIVGWDDQGRILAWNSGAAHLFGYSANEAVGRDARDVGVPADKVDEVSGMLDEVRQGLRVAQRETTRRRKDGKLLEISISANPVYGSLGDVVGAAVTAHDIGDRKQAERSRLALEREEGEIHRLKEISRIRTEFLTEAAHELKTPLTPVLIHVQLLQDAEGMTESSVASLQVIERNVRRLSQLVNHLLDASRLEAGELQLQTKVEALPGIIEQAIRAVEPQARAQDLTVETAPLPSVDVIVDAVRIQEVLGNLLSNAIKFTDPGGHIRVAGLAEGAEAHVVVSDDGRGLTAEQMEQIFSPFGRLQEDVRGTATGTGLGLYISKAIVEEHGGRMWAESKGRGKGTAIGFTLPLAAGPVPHPQAVT